MITLPQLTQELLDDLGREMGGYDFTDPHQQEFLSSLASRDVQAAPGNGKTTLLVAKLALLSREWTDRHRGVCVVSHTNAAREEVQRRLGKHPTASAFLAYPHFIGTVTSFIDQFIAIPYLRGLGWPLRRIDDEAFERAAKLLIAGKPTLRAVVRMEGGAHRVEGWVGRLQLDEEFRVPPNGVPQRLEVRRGHRQPGSHTPSGRELEEIKATLVGRGLYRFGDMMVLARRALAVCPHLADRLRTRFPIVLLDEAQDTHGEQLELLRQVFGLGAIFQCVGDQNQTLYENPDIAADRYWRPGGDLIPLNTTRRFGRDIAAFASRVTVRSPQNIVAVTDRQSHRLLVTFDHESVGQVLPSYARWVANHFPGDPHSADIRAVASRHNLYSGRRGGWPKSLVDYHPEYRSGDGRGNNIESFCGAMRRLATGHETGRQPRESHGALTAAIVDFLDHHGAVPTGGGNYTAGNVWKALSNDRSARPVDVRQLVIENVIRSGVAWEAEPWGEFCGALRELLGLERNARADAYCHFEPQGADEVRVLGGLHTVAFHHGIRVRLGSVHSVKGLTVDALLMVEAEIWRGPAREQQVMDLAVVLPHAFGVENRDFSRSDAQLAAATNVFVAVTRPRTMLALAIRREALSPAVRAAAEAQGWTVADL